ncbi:hypothetical protein PR048_019702 [Dryococelus australis]|uniref:Uncharacterized protein n=1 Tax=Dryococelus australis TaxID=614101 RepID=A0ABQ9H4H3_9NEOP|nr:hypothetical protein PR048_019702 [Dryococelus australis]
MQPANQEVQLAMHGKQSTSRRNHITIEIRDIATMTNTFVSCDLREEVILGVPWLSEKNAIVEPAAPSTFQPSQLHR